MDTADWAERMCSAYLCKKYKKTGIEDFGYGKGYAYLAEEFAAMLSKLTELQNSGMHVLALAHSTIRKLELPEENGTYDHYELKCSKTVSPLVKEWADGLLFVNYRTFIQANATAKARPSAAKSAFSIPNIRRFATRKTVGDCRAFFRFRLKALQTYSAQKFPKLQKYQTKTNRKLGAMSKSPTPKKRTSR